MKTMKRIAALLLTLCLLIGMPMLIQAEETTEDTFEVSHVVEMPDWMAQNENDKGRTLLLYFNSDPTSAPPTNWRYFITIHYKTDKGSQYTVWAKYNDSYAFDNHNPIAITMMTQEEANTSGYSSPTDKGYDGTIQDYFAEKTAGKPDRILRAVIADNGPSVTNNWDGCLQGNFKNANGTKLKSNRDRQNGYNHLTPAVEEALTLDKVVKSGDNTFVAEFSEPINTDGFGKTWGISLNVTNDNGDLMQTETAGEYDGKTGGSGTFYQKDAVSIEQEKDGSSRYIISFEEGDIARIQGWLDKCIEVKGNTRSLRLRVYDMNAKQKANCFIDPLTAQADGNPLLMHWKRVANGVTNIKASDYEFYGIMEATIGGSRYSTLEKALATATSGKTICVEIDLIKDMVMVPAGVTLDLNGHELETDILMSFGNVIDNMDGKGKLVTSKTASSVVHIQPNNPDMPLYDTDGYRFFTYTLESAGTQNDDTAHSVKFGVQLTFENPDAYALLANGGSAAFDMKLSVMVGEKVTNLTYTFSSSVLKKYQGAWTNPDRDTTKTPTLVLIVSGIAGIDKISCTPHVYSTTTFAGQTGSELIYPVTVAE